MKNILLFILLGMLCIGIKAQNLQSPKQFFGFEPGSDRMLFSYEKLIEYLKMAELNSDRLKLEEIGKSPMGKPMYIAFISSADNIANLNSLKEINKQLALNPSIGDDAKAKMLSEGKVFILGTLSMHSSEVGPSQAAPLITYELITSKDSELNKTLENVVYMMVPCHNPDGMDMIVDNYNEYKGTKYEGSSMPGVYHKYVGHDNNRDFIILSQSDTKAISEITSSTWFPQVMVEKHQMGLSGPRYFVPPNHDPIAENVDAELFLWGGLFGQNMVNDMTNSGLKGVSQHYIFDNYWPGSTETCLWKNVIAFLTEAASARTATPVYIEPGELRVGGKGLSEYKKGVNMLSPWPGGWWRLGDIVQYEIVSTKSILKTASLHHDKILSLRNELCIKEINKGKTEAPFYYVLPKVQKDQSELVNLVNLMKEHGTEVHQLTADFLLENHQFRKGDIVFTLAQPFRTFVKEVMEAQVFPERHYTPEGELIEPYDITTWSLPLHKGLDCHEIKLRNKQFEENLKKIEGNYSLNEIENKNAKFLVFSSSNNESYKIAFYALNNSIGVEQLQENTKIENNDFPAGSFIIKSDKKLNELIKTLGVPPVYSNTDISGTKQPLKMPRIALIENYFHDMDAGWTRYIFDSYDIKFQIVHPGDFEKTDFQKNFDLVIFPDAASSILMEGKYKRGADYYMPSLPSEYTKGIGKKGMENLMSFSQNGGLIISWGRSTDLFNGILKYNTDKQEEEFQLPYNNIGDQLEKKGLACPGSLVEIKLKSDHHLCFGLDNTTNIFYRGNPVFTTSIPNFDMDRRVIASFGEKDVLLSGYIKGEENLANRAAMIWMKKGKGQFIFMAFSPIFRASTPASYKLLFNSILTNKL